MNFDEDSKLELIYEPPIGCEFTTQNDPRIGCEFITRNDANICLQYHGFNKNNKGNFCKVEPYKEFYESSLTNKLSNLYYPDVIKQLKSFKKTSTFDVKHNPLKTKHSRMIICYKDLTDSSSIVFIVRIIKKI